MSKKKLKSFKIIPKVIRVPFETFLETESASGIFLAACTIMAMIIANGPLSIPYAEFFEKNVLGLTIHHWINDGLMTIFFFVVGMEIKKEIIAGELSSFKKAAFPIAAALGGMIVPAIIYLFFNKGSNAYHGWAIPMATDIAFALGVLTLFGSRVPLALKIFLLALAIADDLGAVAVIAFFFTSEIKTTGLLVLTTSLILIFMAKKFRCKFYLFYVVLGAIAWGGTLYSGVHATIAGVLIGLMTPNEVQDDRNESSYSPLDDLIDKLHPWVSFGIMPIFALANAGISVRDLNLKEIAVDPIFSGVWLGLLFGKPLGILIFSFLSVKLGFAALPKGLRWKHIVGVSILAGIGFTMALFISGLSMSSEHTVYAKAGILFGSLAAGLIGYIWLKFALGLTVEIHKTG